MKSYLPLRRIRHKLPETVYYIIIALGLLMIGWYGGILTAEHYFNH